MSKIALLCPALALVLALAPLPALAHHDKPAEHAADGTAMDASTPGAPGAPAAALGALVVQTPWSRATPPMANVAAGYFTIRNEGEAERLVSATSPAAARVEIHFMEMANDVMTMREMADGVAIPANGEIAFAPGGYHLMLVGLSAPLVEGEHVPVTLTFEGGALDIVLDVQGMGARSGPVGHGGH